jgi:hypothetical protein
METQNVLHHHVAARFERCDERVPRPAGAGAPDDPLTIGLFAVGSHDVRDCSRRAAAFWETEVRCSCVPVRVHPPNDPPCRT